MADEEEKISRKEFEDLRGGLDDLADAIAELGRARPADQPAAQQQVAQRELTIADHAKALGLTVKQVEALKEEGDYERFRKFQERLAAEKAAEENGDGEDEGEGEGEGEEEKRDGLGGLRNLIRP